MAVEFLKTPSLFNTSKTQLSLAHRISVSIPAFSKSTNTFLEVLKTTSLKRFPDEDIELDANGKQTYLSREKNKVGKAQKEDEEDWRLLLEYAIQVFRGMCSTHGMHERKGTLKNHSNYFQKEISNIIHVFSLSHYTDHIVQEPRKEEFSDWPHGLLAIGTFGNNDLKEDSERHELQENLSSPEDQIDFTAEEVGKIQEELTKLLSRKPVSKGSEGETTNLPLDKFLNCPSSLEVDRTICYTFCNDSNDKNVDLQRSSSVVLSKGKDVSMDHNSNAIRKRSLSFLLKKMFVCGSGFAPAPSLRDPLSESRMEKLLRAILHKKIYPQKSSPSSSMKKYLENRHTLKTSSEDEMQEKANDGCKWVKTDSECMFLLSLYAASLHHACFNKYCSRDINLPPFWLAAERLHDIYIV
ncbi:hypothetical protein HHK36_032803 [Tetracentron sinense]|uniref:Uncharacterized protein n=1 Tax=Tetracentron sinense TaxID=13715 RepID=A0A834Y8H6_TETSI|nr:hypothetical protein HHK36_032803 [Tetracentron sinense]